jgi:hypothetical protein
VAKNTEKTIKVSELKEARRILVMGRRTMFKDVTSALTKVNADVKSAVGWKNVFLNGDQAFRYLSRLNLAMAELAAVDGKIAILSAIIKDAEEERG